RIAIRDQPIHALLHLRGGLLREGQREDFRWPRPLLRDEPGDAAGEDRGLARPGSSDDEERAVAMGDRLPLASGQVRQQRWLEPEGWAYRPGGGSGELLEDWELIRRRDDGWHELDGRRERIHPAVIADVSDTYPV